MKKLILIDVDGVVLNWDDTFEWWVKRTYGIDRDHNANDYSGGVYGRYKLPLKAPGSPTWTELVEEFNLSDECAKLPPLRDSIKYIRILHEEYGFVFQAITAFEGPPKSQANRIDTLRRYFGTAIWGVDFVSICGDKTPILEAYADSGIPWVEDKVSNAEIGLELGLKSYLMMHKYNEKDAMTMNECVIPVANWKDLCYNLLNDAG